MKRPPPTEAPEFRPLQSSNHRDKKTRELPNLSDCNCCNRRINSLNPKYKLGILTSEWRIVLLCKSCYNLVESSKLCSYCLTRVSSEFYDCKKCRRRIHKDCVSKFSFGFSGNCCDEFSVCFDCWIPNLLENEYNRSRIVRSKKQLGKNGVELKNVVNDGNVVAANPIVLAMEAKGKVFTKGMAVEKAMEVGSDALGIVSIDKGGADAQLAIRLHREMNSSRRISRNVCTLNTHCVDVPELSGLESRGAIETGCSDMEMGCLGGQERKRLSGGGEDGKCNGDSTGRVITYMRKGRVSKGGKCKVERGCPMKVYGRKLSPVVKMEVGQCSSQVVKVEAGQCDKTYIRKRLQRKSKLVNKSLNLENGNLGPDTPSTCHEETKALPNGT